MTIRNRVIAVYFGLLDSLLIEISSTISKILPRVLILWYSRYHGTLSSALERQIRSYVDRKVGC